MHCLKTGSGKLLMLVLQCVAIAKKLRVDDKIIAFVKEICLLGVVCKVLNRKTLSGETFCCQN